MTKHTPWGGADYCKEYAPGIVFYGTPSHGGFHLDREQQAKMPDYMRQTFAGGPWYEEDCDWARVAVVFPEAFSKEDYQAACNTLKNWNPEIYQRFFGVKLDPSDSYVLRQDAQRRT